MSKKQIVVLGGSYGGVSVSHHLLKHTFPVLPDKESYQLVLVSTSAEAMCRPANPRALLSEDMFPQDKLFVSTPKQFEQYPAGSFRFVQGSATALDHTNRSVTVTLPAGGTEKLDYYALVIATGSSTPSPLLSLNSGDEKALRRNWETIRKALPGAKTIVVAGGGPTGVETAGELAEFLNGPPSGGWFRAAKRTDFKVSVTLVTSGAQILPIIRPSLAKTAEEYLANIGVTVIKKVRVTSVTPEGAGSSESQISTKTTVNLSDGKTLEADLYIPAVGTTPNTKFIDGSLLTTDGRVDTNGSTLRVDKAGDRVYAIGDAASSHRPAIHLTIEAIPVLGANIKRDLVLAAGGTEAVAGKERTFTEDKRETHIVPIGKSKGVGAAMGWSLPGFVVWFLKGKDYWLWTTGPLWSGKQWAKAG